MNLGSTKIHAPNLGSVSIEGIRLGRVGVFGKKVNWTPARITTSLWLDAADASTITESGGAVSQWDDKSGNGNHAVQGSGAQQPTTDIDQINGLNTLTFAGNDFLKANYAIFSNRATMDTSIFLVLKKDNVDDGFNPIIGGYNSSAQLCYPEVAVHFEVSRLNTRSTPVLDTGISGPTSLQTPTILGLQTTSTTLRGYANGAIEYDLSTTTMTPTTGDDGINIGHRQDGGFGDGFVGRIGEVLIFQDATLTDADRQRIEGYLAHKWGLTANLPSGHPYKTVAP